MLLKIFIQHTNFQGMTRILFFSFQSIKYHDNIFEKNVNNLKKKHLFH